MTTPTFGYTPGHAPVQGEGRYDAPVLWIGEAPGQTEVAHGRPFIGKTGWNVRRGLERYGVDAGDVRFTNVSPWRVSFGKHPAQMMATVAKYWDHLTVELASAAPRVVVACGRAALYRLTGLSKIGPYINSAWRIGDLPRQVAIGSTLRDVGWRAIHDTATLVASLHPASAMRQKIGADWLRIEKAYEKTGYYAIAGRTHDFAGQDLDIKIVSVDDDEDGLCKVNAALNRATVVSVDTEFDPSTYRPYLIGLATDPRVVYSIHVGNNSEFDAKVRTLLTDHFTRRDLTKVAHYCVADIAALRAFGVSSTFPWWDTLEGFSHLYPDLPVGLSHVAAFYIRGYNNHKSMSRTDDRYNAIDAASALIAFEHEFAEMQTAGHGLLDSFQRERMPVAVLFKQMEDLGLQVDNDKRLANIEASHQRETALLGDIHVEADELFAGRVADQGKLENATASYIAKLGADSAETLVVRCVKHASYTGLRAKRWATDTDCVCRAVYAAQSGVRETIDAAKASRVKVTTKRRRWETKGFDPGNNEHVRWLLYDKRGLGLRKQLKDGKVTANATAIARLLETAVVRAKPKVAGLLQAIKDVQHERKIRAGFLFEGREAKIDDRGVVHPPHRAFGTGTGRPAGGASEETEERKPNPYAFNVFNIPKEQRDIYVPHTAESLTARTTPMDLELDDETDEEDEDE